jgi:hypothetical protein
MLKKLSGAERQQHSQSNGVDIVSRLEKKKHAKRNLFSDVASSVSCDKDFGTPVVVVSHTDATSLALPVCSPLSHIYSLTHTDKEEMASRGIE